MEEASGFVCFVVVLETEFNAVPLFRRHRRKLLFLLSKEKIGAAVP
jgi:hypothetical protein